MKWHNAAYESKSNAELCKKELDEAGIETGEIYHCFINDNYYVLLRPKSEKELADALKIVRAHIDY